MLKIGFLDAYLDNWHANEYPGFLREAIRKYGYDAEITAAYAYYDLPGGTSTDEWCAHRGIRRAESPEELLDTVDAVMVIGADDARLHALCEPKIALLPLASSKPVFVDKTFSADLASAKDLFRLADEHHTPVFSSSAQRYCQSILDYQRRMAGTRPRFVSTVGPHSLDNYAVHQLEPMVALMGCGAKRVKSFPVGDNVTQMMIDWGDGRMGSFLQTPNKWAEFNFMVSDGKTGERLASEDYYINLMNAILSFFVTGISPVPREETLEVMALIDAARASRQNPDIWLEVEH